MLVFGWSIYNGSTYYIDVFGKRFQKELEAMKAEVEKWQATPELSSQSPLLTPSVDNNNNLAPLSTIQAPNGERDGRQQQASKNIPVLEQMTSNEDETPGRSSSTEHISLTDGATTTGADRLANTQSRGRQVNVHQ